MNDFDTLFKIFVKANVNIHTEETDTNYPCMVIPSPHPENYTTGVTLSFNDNGSLYSIHSYEPIDD